MSSASSEIHESLSPSSSRTRPLNTQYTPPRRRLSGSGDRSTSGSNDLLQFSSPDRVEATTRHDQIQSRHRVSKSKGFLLGSDAHRTSPKQANSRYGSLKRKDVFTSAGKGKSRTTAVSLLSTEVDNANEEEVREEPDAENGADTGRSGQRSTALINTDQSQIVNLALNLSENRRRLFSSSRLPSAENANRVSIRSITSPVQPTVGHAFSQRSSTLVPPSTRPSTDEVLDVHDSRGPRSPPYPSGRTSIGTESFQVSGLPIGGIEDFAPSAATLSRVQKAKESLELFYEYRRLLQYLPKLPIDSNIRLGSRHRSSVNGNNDAVLGREYNALQYIRNRKVRRRENKPLQAIGQGWNHVSIVRQWVDDVKDEREQHVSSIDNRYPLPHFPPLVDGLAFPTPTANAATNGVETNPTQSNETRQRVDWMVEPWNLLADAYWLDQDNNKQLIEDSKLRKIYPAPLAAPIDLRKEAIRGSERRSSSLSRSIRGLRDFVPIDSGKQDNSNIERGRTSHLRHHSIDSSRGYSASRDRKAAWRRIIGSQSPPSTDNSVYGGQQERPNGLGRLSAKDRQQALVLERQLMDLMAKQSRDGERIPEDSVTTLLNDQSFHDMHSRPSSPDDNNFAVSERNQQSHLESVHRSREMQPRRFSVNLNTRTGDKNDNQNIAINISPPRSRSRGARPQLDVSSHIAHLSAPNSEDEARLSPKSAHRLRRSSDTADGIRPQSSKDFDSRLRGLLKGTKIVDIVNHPASKVGDLIWKRDQSNQELPQSPTGSNADYSDADDLASRRSSIDRHNSSQFAGQYGENGLPVFKSPFRGRQRGRSSESVMNGVVSGGPRTPTQERGVSNLRIETPSSRLAPNLDPSRGINDVSEPNNERPTVRQPSAQRRHAVTKMGGHLIAATSSSAEKQISQLDQDRLSWFNITQRLLSPVNRIISPKDVRALRALAQCALHSSDITLQQTRATHGHSVYSRARQELTASASCVSMITSCNAAIGSHLVELSQTTIPDLHSSLTDIETHVISGLSPVVREAGDDADKLSAQLATTCTLEVKRLNDTLDFISRRQRRKFRWLRRGMYWSLEWMVLGLMWWVWLLVVCFRLVRGVIRAVARAGAWLFWL